MNELAQTTNDLAKVYEALEQRAYELSLLNRNPLVDLQINIVQSLMVEVLRHTQRLRGEAPHGNISRNEVDHQSS